VISNPIFVRVAMERYFASRVEVEKLHEEIADVLTRDE